MRIKRIRSIKKRAVLLGVLLACVSAAGFYSAALATAHTSQSTKVVRLVKITGDGTIQWTGKGSDACAPGTTGNVLWIFNPHSDAVPVSLTVTWSTGQTVTYMGWTESGQSQDWHLTVNIVGAFPPKSASVSYSGTLGNNPVLTISGCNESPTPTTTTVPTTTTTPMTTTVITTTVTTPGGTTTITTPGGTTTVTTPGQTTTVTVPTTTTLPATTVTTPAQTTTVVQTVPGPTQTVTVSGSTQTVTTTTPGPTQTVTVPGATQTVTTTSPGKTITVKVPGKPRVVVKKHIVVKKQVVVHVKTKVITHVKKVPVNTLPHTQ